MADDGWPEYDVPAEALDEGVTSSASPAAPAPTATPPAAPAAAPASPPAPAAAAPGTKPAAVPEPSDPGAMVPKWRLDEVLERERATVAQTRATAAEVATLRSQLQDLQRTATQPPRPAAAPPDPASAGDPRDEQIRTRLETLYPELRRLNEFAKLAEMRGDLEASVAATSRAAAAETAFYDRHTDDELNRLYDMAAKDAFGADKTAADLPALTKETLDTAFAKWVARDPARVARYDQLDKSLVGEFWPIYRAAMFDPVRRSHNAGVLTAAAGRPKLPVGGSIAGPVAPAPASPVTAEDEDAMHERAWALAQQAAGS